MNKILASLVASAAFISVAFAGEIEGVVKSFDAATKTITLEDGSAYVLAEGVVVDGLAAGAKVKVTFDDATKAATAVEMAKM